MPQARGGAVLAKELHPVLAQILLHPQVGGLASVCVGARRWTHLDDGLLASARQVIHQVGEDMVGSVTVVEHQPLGDLQQVAAAEEGKRGARHIHVELAHRNLQHSKGCLRAQFAGEVAVHDDSVAEEAADALPCLRQLLQDGLQDQVRPICHVLKATWAKAASGVVLSSLVLAATLQLGHG